MLKRRTEMTPAEKRAWTRRAVFYSTFAAFLVGLLLAIAWFGLQGARRNPPTVLAPAMAPDSVLVFDVANTLEEIQSWESELARELDPQVRMLREAFGSKGQVFFWQESTSAEARWMAYVPLRRPQRVFTEKIRRILDGSGYFIPANQEADEEMAGRYRILSSGLLIFSSEEEMEYEIEPGAMDHAAGATSHYTSESGDLPRLIERQIADKITLPEKAGFLDIEWDADSGEGSGEVRISFLVEDPEGIYKERNWTMDFFHPFLPSGEEREE